jgi:hypothetical protein
VALEEVGGRGKVRSVEERSSVSTNILPAKAVEIEVSLVSLEL